MAEPAHVLFAALGDEVRLHLVTRLSREGRQSISRLAGDAGVTRQAVTKHLQVLEDAGLVTAEREGRERVFELAPRRLEQARKALEQISQRWDDTLDRLAAFVEK